MKKIMTKTLALLLTLVMVVGLVPFASAVEAEITCNKDAVWPGQTVTLTMKLTEGTGLNGVSWSDGISGSSNQVSYKVPEDATGSVTVSATAHTDATPSNPEGEPVSASITLDVLEPAVEGEFSISGASTAMVGEPVTFSASGAKDSSVSWSVEGGDASINSSGRFKANAEGTYTVTAKAANGGAFAPVTDSATITVTAADYTVTLKDRDAALSSGTAVMSYTITPDATPESVSFSSSNTSVATIDDDGVATLKKKGETTITVSVTIDGVVYKDEAVLSVADEGTITCAQDGKENGGDTVTMTFKLNGVNASNVDWDFSLRGDGDFEITDKSTGNTSASITIEADDIGVAVVDVTATWADGEASGTFYTSFYQTVNVKAQLKDGVDKFDFDKTGVFEKVSGSSNPTRQSMYSFLTDGVATRVILTEDYSGNSRVGKITCANASSFAQYDPDDENDYSLSDLDELTFRVTGSGTYKLDYELYAKSGGYGYTTTKGTIQIISGEGAGSDIEYTVANGGSVTFDPDDFEEFWEDNGEDDEDLLYVTFDVATSTSMTGGLYANNGKDPVKSAWKFYLGGSNKSGAYDLDDVTYTAAKGSKSYEEEIGFVCYGEDGSKASGIIIVTVGDTKIAFTDISTSDWFYENVLYVYTKGIMNGTSDTKFEPNATLNRAMVVTMLYRMEGSPATASTGTFSDVTSGQWYTEAVEWAAKNDIVNGVGNGKFAPTNAITREQLAAILYRYAAYAGKDVSVSTGLSSYSDADKVADYAVDAMKWAVGAGIITGDAGKLMPQGSATRAQAAAMFSRFMQTKSSSKNDDDMIVYITSSGTKYHYDEDCAGKNAKEKKLSKVEDDYNPCSKCVD